MKTNMLNGDTHMVQGGTPHERSKGNPAPQDARRWIMRECSWLMLRRQSAAPSAVTNIIAALADDTSKLRVRRCMCPWVALVLWRRAGNHDSHHGITDGAVCAGG